MMAPLLFHQTSRRSFLPCDGSGDVRLFVRTLIFYSSPLPLSLAPTVVAAFPLFLIIAKPYHTRGVSVSNLSHFTPCFCAVLLHRKVSVRYLARLAPTPLLVLTQSVPQDTSSTHIQNPYSFPTTANQKKIKKLTVYIHAASYIYSYDGLRIRTRTI